MKESNFLKNYAGRELEQSPASLDDIKQFEKEVGPLLLEAEQMIGTASKENSQTKELLKKVSGIIFQRILPVYIASLVAIYLTQKSEGSFSEKDRAKQEMAKKGITSERFSCYKPGLSEFVYRGIYPYSYEPNQNFEGFFDRITGDVEENEKKGPHRYDAWRLYLGLPQKFNTFGISDYRPQDSKEDKYYYKINDLTYDLPLWNLESLVKRIKGGGRSIPFNQGQLTSHPQAAVQDIMRNYTLSMGEDEKGSYISYYDKWDLDVSVESSGAIGEPYEIYDRIYYDPATWKIIDVRSHFKSSPNTPYNI